MAVQKTDSFPRGGSLALNPLEYRDVVEEATKDSLLPQKVKRPSKSANGSGNAKKLRVDEEFEEESVKVDTLSYKRLATGQILLAAIREITDLDLVVSLPSQLTGYVSITEISAKYTEVLERAAEDDSVEVKGLREMFSVGQIVPVVIIELTTSSATNASSSSGASGKEESQKKRIELSMNPQYVNKRVTRDALCVGQSLSVSVVSVEDHGVVVDAGIIDTHFFMPSSSLSTLPLSTSSLPLSTSAASTLTLSSLSSLTPGQLLQCTVTTLSTAKTQIKLSPRQLTPLSTSTLTSFSSMVPGTAVECTVEGVCERGVKCLVNGLFEGSLGVLHLDGNTTGSFKPKQKLTAVVIFQDSDAKTLLLSLNQNLLTYTPHSFSHVIGSTLAATIGHADHLSLLATLEQANEHYSVLSHPGHIHISRASDTPIKRFTLNHAIGSTHPSRVIALDYLDGVYLLSLQSKTLQQQFLRHEDIKVGQLVTATVTKCDISGVLATLGSLTCLIPLTHLSDILLKTPEKKFIKGLKVRGHVLHCDVEKRRIILTLKKSLVQSQFEVVGEYDGENVGKITRGVVKRVEGYGLVLSFYGNVTGICLRSDVGNISEDWQSEFTVGKVVTCKVLSVNPSEQKMRVTLNLTSKLDVKLIHLGSVHWATVLSKEAENVLVELDFVEVGVVTGGGSEVVKGVVGVLAKEQLSDFGGFVEVKWKEMRKGVRVQVLVVDRDIRNARVIVTMKPLLLKSQLDKLQSNGQGQEEQDEQASEHLKLGQRFIAFVEKITDTFLTVRSSNGQKLVVMKKNVREAFTSDISDVVRVGMTVEVELVTIHEDSRMEGSMRVVVHSDREEWFVVDAYMKEKDEINSRAAELQRSGKKSTEQTTAEEEFKIGSSVDGVVVQAVASGYILSLPLNYKGLLTLPSALTLTTYQPGHQLTTRILTIDSQKRILDLGLVPSKTTKNEGRVGSKYECVVEHVGEWLGVVSCKGLGGVLGRIGYRSLNQAMENSIGVKVGDKVSCVLVRLDTEGSLMVFALKQTANQHNNTSTKESTTKSKAKEETSQIQPLKKVKLFKNPVDPKVDSAQDLVIGSWINVKVKSRKEMQVNVQIADNVFGRIHLTQLYSCQPDLDSTTLSSETTQTPLTLTTVKPGQILKARIIGFHDSRTHKYLPFSNNGGVNTMTDFTLRPEQSAQSNELSSLTSSSTSSILDLKDVQLKHTYLGVVAKVELDAVWVALSATVQGRVYTVDASHEPEVCKELKKWFKVGQGVRCAVTALNLERHQLDLSMKEADAIVGVGSVTCGKVCSIPGKEVRGEVVVQVTGAKYGRVHVCEMNDVYSEKSVELVVGGYVKCSVVAVAGEKYELSLRESLLAPISITTHSQSQSYQQTSNHSADLKITQIVEGQHVKGFVKTISDAGCFISLTRTLVGRCKISEMSDLFVKEFRGLVRVGQVVEAVVLSINIDQQRIELSLKPSLLSSASHTTLSSSSTNLSIHSLSLNQLLPAKIHKLEPFGVFLTLLNTSPPITGLCHISQLSKEGCTHPSELFEIGDLVVARVLSVTEDNKGGREGRKRVNFSLIVDEGDAREVVREEEDRVEIDQDEEMGEDEEMSENEEMSQDDETINQIQSQESSEHEQVTPMDIDAFTWTDTQPTSLSQDSQSDSDSDLKAAPQKRSKRQKESDKKLKERLIDQTERALLSTQPSTTPLDYERDLLANPNASYIWIQYMAHHLHLSDTDSARTIATRALQKIAFREEQEKLNIWIALLNLETTHGTQITLDQTYKRALEMCDGKKIGLGMGQILDRCGSGRREECKEVFEGLVKKFGGSCKVWCGYAMVLMKWSLVEFRAVMKRALIVLPKRKHVKTIIKFAQMEYKHGDPERARTIFEGVLNSYPKRVDLWNVYIDMEIKSNKVECVRRIFERVTTQKGFSSKKMKFLFKKWLEFEKLYGDESGCDRVKVCASGYVEGRAGKE